MRSVEIGMIKEAFRVSKHYATTEDKALMKTGTINPMVLYQNKILSAKAGLYVIDGTVS